HAVPAALGASGLDSGAWGSARASRHPPATGFLARAVRRAAGLGGAAALADLRMGSRAAAPAPPPAAATAPAVAAAAGMHPVGGSRRLRGARRSGGRAPGRGPAAGPGLRERQPVGARRRRPSVDLLPPGHLLGGGGSGRPRAVPAGTLHRQPQPLFQGAPEAQAVPMAI